MPVVEATHQQPDDDDLGALAASLTGLEPELRTVAARVRHALRRFEVRFADDPEGYEAAREHTGAAALYDAAIRLADALDEAVRLAPLSEPSE